LRRAGLAGGALRAGAAAAACLAAAAALAYVPPIDRIARAVADANRVHGRARVLAMRVALEGEGGAVLATGSLLSDPRGAARLEVRHESGFVERQLRRGRALEASRDRARLADPHPLLPPLFLLQTDQGATLQTRIAELGGSPDAVALGYEGDHDCYVLGGKHAEASYWVDQESFAPVRIDLPGGVRYRLGPPRTQGGVEMPAWIALEAPGRPSLTLTIAEARPEAAPPDAFDPGWLTR
jgi:hypothetical protein